MNADFDSITLDEDDYHAPNPYGSPLTYGQLITASIEGHAMWLFDWDEWDFTLADVLDRDDQVVERAERQDFAALRRSKNGRTVLAAWKARAMAVERETRRNPQTGYFGFAPPDEAAQTLQILSMRDDEAFRYCVDRDPEADRVVWKPVESDDPDTETTYEPESQFDRWDKEDRYIRERVAEARRELLDELAARGVDPKIEAVQHWLRKQYSSKADRYAGGEGPQRQLAALRSCIHILRHGLRTPFPYDGLR